MELQKLKTWLGRTLRLGKDSLQEADDRVTKDPVCGMEIDRAVKEAVDEAFGKAVGILKASRTTLENGAQALLQKETLVEEDLQKLVAVSGAREVAAVS